MNGAYKRLGIKRSSQSPIDNYQSFAIDWKNINMIAYNKMAQNEKKRYIKEMEDVEQGLVGTIKQYFKANENIKLNQYLELPEKELQSLLFYPKAGQEAVSSAIWNAIPSQKLIGHELFVNLEHKIIKKLTHFSDSIELNALLNAFKIRLIRNQPEIYGL
jgi:hypothetical protein